MRWRCEPFEMEMRAEEVTAAIARGGVAEREAAYVALELAVREAGHPACTPAARCDIISLLGASLPYKSLWLLPYKSLPAAHTH